MSPHSSGLQAVEHVHRLVLDHLEGGDGPVELHPFLGVFDRQVVGLLGSTDHLGAEGHRAVVGDASPDRGVITVGAHRLGLGAVEVQAGDPPGLVPGGHEVTRGASTANVPIPCSVRAATSTQSAGARRAPASSR